MANGVLREAGLLLGVVGMSEPYEAHFKHCEWCGEDVQPEDYDKDHGACSWCMRAQT